MRKFFDMLSHQNQYYSVKTSFKQYCVFKDESLPKKLLYTLKCEFVKNIYDNKFISVVIYKYKKL